MEWGHHHDDAKSIEASEAHPSFDECIGEQADTAVASQVEHTDVGSDVRILLLNQSGRYKRQGGMEAAPDRGVSGVLE
jgi:hypothetical protein